MRVIDCPTENMWADVLSKPLQGMVFKGMQAKLMNCSVEYEEDEEREAPLHTKSLSERRKVPSQTPQECVGDSTKSHKATDRQVGVSRLVRHLEASVQMRGRE